MGYQFERLKDRGSKLGGYLLALPFTLINNMLEALPSAAEQSIRMTKNVAI